MNTKPGKLASSLFSLVVFGTVIFVGYGYREDARAVAHQLVWQVKPCSIPITYSIGTLDSRFGLSKEQFANDIKKAASKWNAPLARDLLLYEEDGGEMTVNLIYDDRQKSTEKLQKVGSVLTAGRNEYQTIKDEYELMLSSFTTHKAELASRIESYTARGKAYNEKVQYWNAKGGAPASQYQELQNEKASLDAESVSIQEDQASLEKEVATLNIKVKELNDVISKYNINVRQYNTVGSSLGAEFNEGEYVERLNKRVINIYQFDNEAALTRVLTHEFGHSLGLEHINTNSKAIMYYLNESKNQNLTSEDVAALKVVCNVKE